MPESIESFVRKLQEEGVQAGRQAAEQVIAEARQQAETILREAHLQAENILRDTQTDAKKLTEQNKNEIALAARDAILQLRENISHSLRVILENEVRAVLADQAFLAELIRDMMRQYAAQDAQRQETIEIRVPPEAVEQVKNLALARLRDEHGPLQKFNLFGTLKKQGFEYTVRESTVEVTVDSIGEYLGNLVTEQVRESLREAVAKK